jgi:hypothetical protein
MTFCKITISGADIPRNVSGFFWSNCSNMLIKMTINPADVFHESGNQLGLTYEVYATVKVGDTCTV